MKDIESTLLEYCRNGKEFKMLTKSDGEVEVIAKEIRDSLNGKRELYCYKTHVSKLGDVGGRYCVYPLSDILDA